MIEPYHTPHDRSVHAAVAHEYVFWERCVCQDLFPLKGCHYYRLKCYKKLEFLPAIRRSVTVVFSKAIFRVTDPA